MWHDSLEIQDEYVTWTVWFSTDTQTLKHFFLNLAEINYMSFVLIVYTPPYFLDARVSFTKNPGKLIHNHHEQPIGSWV